MGINKIVCVGAGLIGQGRATSRFDRAGVGDIIFFTGL